MFISEAHIDPVKSPVRGLPSNCHQRSLSHYTDSHTIQAVTPKPLEVKPATISRKSVTAKANASSLAEHRKGDQRPFFLNGCQWMRGFTTLNKQLFRLNS